MPFVLAPEPIPALLELLVGELAASVRDSQHFECRIRATARGVDANAVRQVADAEDHRHREQPQQDYELPDSYRSVPNSHVIPAPQPDHRNGQQHQQNRQQEQDGESEQQGSNDRFVGSRTGTFDGDHQRIERVLSRPVRLDRPADSLPVEATGSPLRGGEARGDTGFGPGA